MSERVLRSLVIKSKDESFPDNPALGQWVLETGWDEPVIYMYTDVGWVSFASGSGGGGETGGEHNSLDGLQGGATGEYYHLDQDDYNALTDANAQLAELQTDGSPTFAGLAINGNITVSGTVDGVDVSDLKADVDGFPDELKNLVTAEIQQLENIDSATISNAQWGYLGELDQSLTTSASPTFSGLTLSGLTASRLMATDASKVLVSASLADWVAGTTNRVLVTNDGDGTITLSAPQDIHTGASPTFANLYVPSGGFIGVSGTDGWTFDSANGDISTTSGLGVGVTDPSAKAHVVSTTEQLRLGYDASDYASFTVSDAGDLTIAPTGGDTNITGNLYASGSLEIDGAATFGDDLTVGSNILFVDYSQQNIGVNCAPDPQFDLDVGGNLRAQGYIVGKHAIQLSDALMVCHFDGPEPYETDFTGEATGHMGQVPTISGGIIFRPGKFLKAVQIAEGTTNYIGNPRAENDLGWWATVDAGVTRSTNNPYIGSACFRFEDDGTSYVDLTSPVIPAGENQDWTISLYYRVDDGDWEKYSATYTTRAGTTGVRLFLFRARSDGRLYVRLDDSSGSLGSPAIASGGTYYYVDAVQLEQKSYATPFADGSLGDGHEWSGAAHASTSTRTATVLYYDNPASDDSGTIALWWQPAADYNDQPTSYLWDEGSLAVYYNSADYKFYFTDGTNTISSAAQSFSAGDDIYVAAAWSGDGLALYINGSLAASGGTYTTPTLGGSLCVGSDTAGANQANGNIDDLAIIGRALTTDKIRSIYESQAPVFAETSVWSWRSANNLAWMDSEGIWARDADGNEVLGVVGVDSKSWGGFTLDKGDVLIGRSAAGAYLKWDASAGNLNIEGNITITGGSGISNLSDAGALAEANTLDDVPDGSSYVRTTPDEKTGASRAYSGLDSNSNLVTSVLPGSNIGTPSGSGLYLGADYLGYYDAEWKVFIDNSGNFTFKGNADNYISWAGTTLEVKGNILITGGQGIGNLTDAGALAEANTLDDVPDGSTYKRTNANEKTGAGRAYSSLDSSGALITRVLPSDLASPSSAGLYLGSDYLGYYDGSAWKAYIQNDGKWYFGGSSDYIQWDGSTLSITGDGSGVTNIDGGNIQTNTITATQIAANTITASEIAADTITANEIAANTITANEIASGTITGDELSLTSYLAINSNTFGSDGIQLQYNSGDPRAYIGNGSDRYFKFDGTTITWKAANTELDTSGNLTASGATISGEITATSGELQDLTVSGLLSLDTTGELRAGTATDGIRFGYLSDGYYLRGVDGGDTQVEIRASDGKLYAGGGNVRLDSDGIHISDPALGTSLLEFSGGYINSVSSLYYTVTRVARNSSNYIDVRYDEEFLGELYRESTSTIRFVVSTTSDYNGFIFTNAPLVVGKTIQDIKDDGFAAGDLAMAGDLYLDGSIYRSDAIGCLVYNDATQPVNSGSWTTVYFNSEWADDWAMHDTSTNTQRITIKKDGDYHITVSAQLTGVASGTYIIRMYWYDDSASSTIVVRDERKRIAATGDTGFTVTADLPGMEANDYVYFKVYQNSGSTANIAASSSTNLYGCSASVYRIA